MTRRRALRWLLSAAAVLGLGAAGFDRWVETAALPPLAAPVSTVVTDRVGQPLRVFLAADDRWRLPVDLSEVDPAYLDLLIAYEDKRFYRHPGVDPIALARAALTSLKAGHVVSGGSTLTMQVARLLDGGGTGSWRAKLRQIRLALALERRLSKDEILALYLMRAPFGGNLEGVRAASFSYFGTDARRLSPEQAALLVALPQSPEARRPDRFPGRARRARDTVLARAAAAGVIAAEARAGAALAPVPDRRRAFPARAWHRAEAARRAAPGAAVIPLTLEAGAQARLEALIAEAAPRLPQGAAAALVAIDHRSGETVAYIGNLGRAPSTPSGFIDLAAAPRSPGSALKPFIYALAFAAGRAHPETLLEDRPTAFGAYAPRNFTGEYRGPVTAREALQASLNVPAVALLDAVGPQHLLSFLRRAGAAPTLPQDGAPGLAIALGGLGVTLAEMTALYAELARAAAGTSALLGDVPAWYVADILRGVPAPPGAPAGAIAYKTGTSYGYRDAWALGFDGAHAIGVWVGRPDGGAMPGAMGAELAAPLLFDAFARLDPQRSPLPEPPPRALTVEAAALPPPLRRLKGSGRPLGEGPRRLALDFPPDGARLALDGAAGPEPLVAKLSDGRPPFVWMVNGEVVAADPRARVLVWPPDGPGFVTLSVIDAAGQTARASVYLDTASDTAAQK